MRDDQRHVPDEDLVAAADGELDAARAAEVRAHLTACWRCRARGHELEHAVEAFVQAHHAEADAQLPAPDGPRALLRARLAEADRAAFPRPAGGPPFGLAGALVDRLPAGRRVWSTGGLAIAVAVLLLLFLSPTLPWTSPSGDLEAFSVPMAELTPGSTVLQSREVVCRERRDAEPPPISRHVALSVFRTYGIDDPRPNVYELDYLIAPELGGSTDVRNLWPQSYAGTWNAHLKDALEDHLFGLVCRGDLELHTAQREIAADWIAAYRKYFGTDEPLQVHRTFRKDEPWR